MDFLKKGLLTFGFDIKQILHRIKIRDFSGNTGLAIKNSIFHFSTITIAKLGSLIFTIILARMLLPELFGLYNLAISTTLLFSTISNLGIGETIITFVSRELSKRKNRIAKAYLVYLGKIKFFLLFISALFLLFSAKFIAENYYKKPLFLGLLAGVLFLICFEIVNFLSVILQTSNIFKGIFQKEIIIQFSRLVLVPLVILLSLKYSIEDEKILFYIILALSVSYFFAAIFMIFYIKDIIFLKSKEEKLNKKRIKESNKFLFITAIFALSGMFFSFIDRIMLGRFVTAEFIGYYSAAINIVSGISSLIGFAIVLLPIFSRIKGKKLEEGFKKSLIINFFLGFFLFLVIIFLSSIIIKIIYGPSYNLSINILRLFSPLLMILPLIGVYSVYFISLKKPKVVAMWLFVSTILNIILNYILITSFLKKGELLAVFGAALAGVLSQAFCLFGLIISKKKRIKI
ncbi:MAG: oligosaccharide flippase family protein [Candidatus Pacearchaeota archaeon]